MRDSVKRWLLHIATPALGLLALACIVEWPLSYWRMSGAYIISPSWFSMLIVNRGAIAMGKMILPGSSWEVSWGLEKTFAWDSFPSSFPQQVKTGKVLGIRWFHVQSALTAVVAPIWLVTLLVCSAFAGAIRIELRMRRLRWGAAGLCACCGYDLRATPQRCPECGKAAVTA